jgi:hypothetical protein
VTRVVITKGPGGGSIAGVGAAAGGVSGVPEMIRGSAWIEGLVFSYQSFMLVDGSSDTVMGESVAAGRDDVGTMIVSTGSQLCRCWGHGAWMLRLWIQYGACTCDHARCLQVAQLARRPPGGGAANGEDHSSAHGNHRGDQASDKDQRDG